MDDSSLGEKLRRGEEKAYEILYKKHYRILCLYACKFVRDSDIAENLVSDVIYNIWDKRESIHITSSLRNYLIQAVKNKCYNYIRQEQRRNDILEEYYQSTPKNIASFSHKDQSEYPSTALLLKELDLKIAESIAKLPTKTRDVFLLSRFSELKYAEIAKKTDLSVDSIKYHIKSALAKLKEDLSRM